MGPEGDDHPLLLELTSLRQTAARFQHEAHTAAINLQRHSLDSSRLHEHAAVLEQENARLTHELDILRPHPDIPHHPAVAQVQELSLALRRVSDKIALTEDTLLQRTSELTDARSELTKTELDKLNLEDQTAAKMVTRYMFVPYHSRRHACLWNPCRKFSQASTNALQQQITTLKARHTATSSTLEFQLSIVESQLASERARTARLQDALDELCEDLARESYGRRREVALRLALLSREEAVAEFMRRWARRARELYARCYNSAQPPATHVSSEDACSRGISSCDDDVQFSDTTRTSGSLARIALSREAVEALRSELQDEVQKRVEAVRRSAFSFLNGHPDETASRIEDLSQLESTPSPACDGVLDQLLLTPNGNARPEHEAPPVKLPSSQDADSPVSIVGAPEESIDDPFAVPAFVAPSVTETTEYTILQWEIPALPSPPTQNSASTSTTLLVEEEPKAAQPHSPAVSMLDLRQDLQPSRAEEPPTTDAVPIHALPNVSPPEANQNAQVLAEDDTPIPSTSISTSMPAAQNAQALAEDNILIPSTLISTPTSVASHAALGLPPPSNFPPALLSELGATKHRYDSLQHAFRDCSLALKELKRTLASSSPRSHTQAKLCQHLETALARIDDYAEDARVELEIRVADEELTARGFETVLTVPGALVDADERAEVEASAREFVEGTDEGVARALEKVWEEVGGCAT
ncbi:hypothetical protein J3R83DRAFT_4614 [Lanmaoa asiatica]|nr:hypothetical protein J3R83DRAFT_4614 [Lanmaoa asiatica]